MKPLDHKQISLVGGTSRAIVPIESGSTNPLGRKTTLLFVSALTIMSGTIIAPSLPGIETHFATDENGALLSRLVLTLPALLIAFCAPLSGILADRFGRRPLLISAIVLYGVAGMSGLVLDTLYGILLGRAWLGVAVAGIMTSATALAGDYFSGPERDRYMGMQAAFIGFSGLVLVTIGGLLAELDWRAPFAVYGTAFALLPAVLVFLKEPRRIKQHDAATADQPTAPGTWAVIAALFAAAVLNSVAFYLIPTQLPFYLPQLGTDAPTLAGLAMGIFNFAMASMSLLYGRLHPRAGIMGMFSLGFALIAAGCGLIALAGSFIVIVVGCMIAGTGLGAIVPNLVTAVLTVAPPAVRGRVAGGLTASIFLGQFLSPLISQPWIARFGYAAAFRDMALLLVAVAIGTGWLAVRGKRARA